MAHHFSAKRYPHEPVKKAEIVPLAQHQPFLRASMPQSIVDMMLRDRDWKEANFVLIPLLAQWRYVQEPYEKSQNFTPCLLKKPETEE